MSIADPGGPSTNTAGWNNWRNWLLVWGVWTFLGVYFASESALTKNMSGVRVSFGPLLVIYLTEGYLWALLTPLIFSITRRYYVGNPRRLVNAFKQLPWSVLFTGGFIVMYYFSKRGLHALFGFNPPAYDLKDFFLRSFHLEYLFYWQIVIVINLLIYRHLLGERELKASQLAEQLTQSQLQSLKMQLHPHFLFNTLNSIHTLIDIDHEAAKKMVIRLSDFLRLTLENSGAQQVTLGEELRFVENYLKIEETRFGERLRVVFDVAPDVCGAPVPNLILQPLVENAVKHGIAPFSRSGEIRISARREGDELILQVQNDGPGLAGADAPAHPAGVGVKNVRERLLHSYGSRQRFVLADGPAGGVLATLAIPFSPGEAGEPPSG